MADKKDNDFRKQHRMRVKTKVYENGFSGLNDGTALEKMYNELALKKGVKVLTVDNKIYVDFFTKKVYN